MAYWTALIWNIFITVICLYAIAFKGVSMWLILLPLVLHHTVSSCKCEDDKDE